MRQLRRFALLAILAAPLAGASFAASAGPLVDNTTVNATNTAAGIGNFAGQSVSGVGGPALLLGHGPVFKDTTVNATNTAAGIGNAALQGIHGIH